MEGTDASLAEINPLLVTKQGDVLALAAEPEATGDVVGDVVLQWLSREHALGEIAGQLEDLLARLDGLLRGGDAGGSTTTRGVQGIRTTSPAAKAMRRRRAARGGSARTTAAAP